MLNLRIVSVTPLKLHGGMTAATRLPSGKRESRMGFDSEMSSPRRRAMFFTATMRDFSPSGHARHLLQEARLLDEHAVRSVDHDFADGVVEDEVLDGLAGTAGSSRIRSSEFSFGELLEVRIVRIVVVGLQVAEHRRHRIQVRRRQSMTDCALCNSVNVFMSKR